MKHALTLALLLFASLASAQAPPDPESPTGRVMSKAPLFIQAIQSVDHLCDRVVRADMGTAPGMRYFHVTCSNDGLGETHYTIAVSHTRIVVYPGEVD